MDTPSPTPPNAGVHSPGSPNASPPATSRGAQVALGVFLVVLVGLLAFRGYGNRLGARPTEPAATDLIDLNSAGRAELAQVPGVGPKLAEAIEDHRRVRGPFRSVDELAEVRGVGPVTFEKIRPHFRVGPAPPAAEPAPASPSPQPPRAAGVKKIQPGEPPINVNTAGAEELQRLPGVGPVTAQAIVAARAARPFESVEDLDRVKGIGPKTLDKLRPFAVVR
jgi:competence protein ComEA